MALPGPMPAPSLLDAAYQANLISEPTYAKARSAYAPSDMVPPTPAPTPDPVPQEKEWEGSFGVMPRTSEPEAMPEEELAQEAATPEQQAEMLLDALAQQESGGNTRAVSPKGAKGKYQLMDATGREYARRLGIADYDPFNEEQGREIAKAFLTDTLKKYKDPELALASFNYGEPKLDAILAKSPTKNFQSIAGALPEETRNYVPGVLSRFNKEKGIQDIPPGQAEALISELPKPKQSENVLDKIESGYAQQREAAVQAAHIGELKAQEDAAYARESEDEMKRAVAEQQAEKARIEQEMKAYETERQQIREKLASQNIDSLEVWSKKGTGEQVATVLGAVLLGTLINPVAGYNLISNSIDRDIERARLPLQERDKELQGLYAKSQAQWKESSDRYWDTRLKSIGFVRDKFGQMASKYNAGEIQSKYMELDGKLQVAEEEAKQRVLDQISTRAAKGMPEDGTFIPSLGQAVSKDAAKTLNDKGPAVQTALSILDEMEKIRASNSMISSQIGDRSVSAEYGALKAKLLEATKSIGNLGALDKGVDALVDKMVPSEQEIVGFRNLPERFQGIDPQLIKIRKTRELLTEQWEREKKALILKPGGQMLGKPGPAPLR